MRFDDVPIQPNLSLSQTQSRGFPTLYVDALSPVRPLSRQFVIAILGLCLDTTCSQRHSPDSSAFRVALRSLPCPELCSVVFDSPATCFCYDAADSGLCCCSDLQAA